MRLTKLTKGRAKKQKATKSKHFLLNVPYPVIYRTPLKSFVMKRMLIICRNVTLIFVKHVGRGWRVVVPARRFVTAAHRFVTYRPRDGMFTARGTVSLPSRRGKFTVAPR